MRAFWLVILVLAAGVGAYSFFGGGGGVRAGSTAAPRAAGAGGEVDAVSPGVAAPAADAATTPQPDPATAAAAVPVGALPAASPTEAGVSMESLRRERADAMMRVQSLRDQVTQVELSIERMPDRADVLTARLAELREQVRSQELRADELAAKIAALAAAMPAVQTPVAAAAPAETPASSRTNAPTGDVGTTTADAEATTTPEAPSAPVDLAAFAAPARIAGFEVTPAKLETREQGGVLVDTRFVIKGSGTASDPFVVPWEMLTSAEEGFAPQAGRKQIPQRVAMLDGKYVRVKGYVAFPLAMDEPRELLAMLNQWDGCCIGVPPTPYDAIEVQLKAGAKGDDRFAISGEVAGRFSVKPYVVGDWLVGMYVMENAEFTARGAPGT